MARKPMVRDEDREWYVYGIEAMVEYTTAMSAMFMHWIEISEKGAMKIEIAHDAMDDMRTEARLAILEVLGDRDPLICLRSACGHAIDRDVIWECPHDPILIMVYASALEELRTEAKASIAERN